MENEPPLETDRFIKAYARENRPKKLWQKAWPWACVFVLSCGAIYAL